MWKCKPLIFYSLQILAGKRRKNPALFSFCLEKRVLSPCFKSGEELFHQGEEMPKFGVLYIIENQTNINQYQSLVSCNPSAGICWFLLGAYNQIIAVR